MESFLNLLLSINLQQIIESDKLPIIEIDYASSHLTLPIPTTQKNLVIHAAQWQSPLFFSMIDDVNIFIEILKNVLLDKSIIVVGAKGSEN